jgi:hypothetical protein
MDATRNEPGFVLAADFTVPADRGSGLAQVLRNLEHSAAILEALDLTLAVALLDHAIAEVRRNAAD